MEMDQNESKFNPSCRTVTFETAPCEVGAMHSAQLQLRTAAAGQTATAASWARCCTSPRSKGCASPVVLLAGSPGTEPKIPKSTTSWSEMKHVGERARRSTIKGDQWGVNCNWSRARDVEAKKSAEVVSVRRGRVEPGSCAGLVVSPAR